MGSGDPSGLQNRRELASLALVSSTLTRFRQSFLAFLLLPRLPSPQRPVPEWPCPAMSFRGQAAAFIVPFA